MKYTIVIVTYNRLDKLKKCLQCAEKQTLKASHIVVVDNASTDGTEEFLSDNKFKKNPYVIKQMPENTGGSGGFHVGIKEALLLSDEWVLLIDDDAMLREDYVDTIMKHMEKGILAYSGNVNEFGKISLEHRRMISTKILYKEYSVRESVLEKEYFDFDLASFCGLMINTEIVRRIGLPRGDFFIWYDDTEYSLRLRKLTKIRNINSAVLDHELTAYKTCIENNHKMNWKVYYGLRNRLYTIKKYGNFASYIYEIIFLAARFCKYAGWRLSMNTEKKMIGKNNCKILKKAISDGIKEKMEKNLCFLP